MHQQHEVAVPFVRSDDLDERAGLLAQAAGVTVAVFEGDGGGEDGGSGLDGGGIGFRFRHLLAAPDQQESGRKCGCAPESAGHARDTAEDGGRGQFRIESAQHGALLFQE